MLGLKDRGTVEVGKRADVNVFDISRLEERMPEIVHDFPFGAPRFIQRAAGYKATVCNGTVVLRDDELTGDRAGQVLRQQRGKREEPKKRAALASPVFLFFEGLDLSGGCGTCCPPATARR